MGWAGAYDLTLDCDDPDCVGRDEACWYHFRETIVRETGASCRRIARKRGWRFDRFGMKALCPECVKAGKKL